MNTTASWAFSVGVFCVASTAAAQQGRTFGAAGTPVFSAERLTGVYVENTELDYEGQASGPWGTSERIEGDTESSTTTLAFLGNSEDLGPAGLPRLAFDFFVIDSLSVGGAIMYASRSEETDESPRLVNPGPFGQPDETHTEVTNNSFAFSPRVGYGLMFTDIVGLWGRGGITYAWTSEETDTEEVDPDNGDVTRSSGELKIDHFSLSLEAMLILSPVDHFGFAVGPYLDIPLTGDAEFDADTPPGPSSFDGDVSVLSFGLSAGILGWL